MNHENGETIIPVRQSIESVAESLVGGKDRQAQALGYWMAVIQHDTEDYRVQQLRQDTVTMEEYTRVLASWLLYSTTVLSNMRSVWQVWIDKYSRGLW